MKSIDNDASPLLVLNPTLALSFALFLWHLLSFPPRYMQDIIGMAYGCVSEERCAVTLNFLTTMAPIQLDLL